MKKTILLLAVLAIVNDSILTGCKNPEKKVEDAEVNVKEANEDLKEAKSEYLTDIENYKKETTEKIAANDKSIADFRSRIALEKKETRADYKKKIDALEKKNTDMKKKIDDYKEEGKENWEKFKVEFSHDMDKMGKAFNDLTVKNTK
ncbi:hypothetical protein [Runella sp.]|uniref:hypothetical protein n=1 Tax=Runella sp. TaxID=1960881 RepID=UPI003D1117F6